MFRSEQPAPRPPETAARPVPAADDDVWRWAALALLEEVAKLPEEARIAVTQGLLERAGHRVEMFDFVPEIRAANRRVHMATKMVSRLTLASLD